MKTDIHPNYTTDSKVTCTSCNKSFNIGSTNSELTVELCYSCHPFYTGTQRLVDTGQRIERFKKRMAQKDEVSAQRKGKKAKNAKRKEAKKENTPEAQ